MSRVGKRGERLISPAEQERRAREHAQQHGLRVGLVLPPDLDESGGKLDRPGLNEALRRVEARESGGIIVAWLDRLSRDSEHAHALVRRISESGGKIYAPDAPADWASPEGELQAGILFAFAQYVRARARAGFERAKAQAIERGIPVNSRAAVGYRKRDGEGQDRTLELDPKIAPVVRAVFERRAQGAGPSELGEMLEDAGVTTSQGSTTWSKPAVYGLLSNRVYLGELRYGRDDRYVKSDAHPPIVDLALWTAAQHPNGRLQRVGATSDWLLAGLLRCASCRYCTQGTTTSRGKRIYRCTRKHAAGVCPSPVRADAALVEDAAIGAFWALTSDLEARPAPAAVDEAELMDDLKRADVALRQYMAAEVQEAIGDAALWARGLRERRETRDQAAEALGRARAGAQQPELPEIETLRGAWARMTTRDRRELLGLRFDALALGRDPLTLTVFPAGTGPSDLPRRGYKQRPELKPFDTDQSGQVVLDL